MVTQKTLAHAVATTRFAVLMLTASTALPVASQSLDYEDLSDKTDAVASLDGAPAPGAAASADSDRPWLGGGKAPGSMSDADGAPGTMADYAPGGGNITEDSMSDMDALDAPDSMPVLSPPPPLPISPVTVGASDDRTQAVVPGNMRDYKNLRWGGKLRLTNGAASLDGASGGGLASWAIIAGKETAQGIGGSVHVTYVELPSYNWQSHGAAIGLFDRLELSYARQNLDTLDVGAALGLGRSYVLNQDVFGAKLRLFGDAIYGPALLPQLSVGVQYKNNLDAPVTAAVGAASSHGLDIYLAASKIVLAQSLLLNGTLRYTKANQLGLLGFGGDKSNNRTIQIEGSAGYLLSRNLVLGAEYRTKPDNLSIAREDDWIDLFAAYSIGDYFTVTAAYVDLGTIAAAERQRGGLLSLQAAF